uniref:Uncharacterized protein n=1 Tax=Coccidioides posadasii RMSCC 3488 TaxID=454284 RepID=A0A0J6FKK9_COCPO|nr:hypothetical protein CPAG_05700 [Coccidioides posadasii RMSCC 3488]
MCAFTKMDGMNGAVIVVNLLVRKGLPGAPGFCAAFHHLLPRPVGQGHSNSVSVSFIELLSVPEERRARYPPTPLPQVVTFDADAERLLREVTTTAASFIDLLTSRPHPFDPPPRPYGRQEARASSSATPHTGARPEPVPAAQPAIPRLP